MRPLGKAVVRAGLVEDSVLSELRRWGLPVPSVSDRERIEDGEHAVRAIQDALDDGDQVRVQDTDLDIVNRWVDADNQVTGKLVLRDGDQKSTMKVIFCWTVMREIAFPWKSEAIEDFLLNGESHLRYTDKQGKEHKCFFVDVRELFIGDTKAFVVASIQDEK